MKNIKSLVGKKVRIKREYLKFFGDSCYLGVEVPFNSLVDNPLNWVGTVHVHFYGIDIPNLSREGVTIEEHEPSHQLIIDEVGNRVWTFAWEAKYFEVVKEVKKVTIEYEVDTDYIISE